MKCCFWKREKGVAIVMGLSPQLHIAPKGPASRIAIKAEKKILFINSADIIAVEAEGNYVLLQHESSGYLLRESISTMAEKLSLFGRWGMPPSWKDPAVVDRGVHAARGGQEICSHSYLQKESTFSRRVVDPHRRFCPDLDRQHLPCQSAAQ